LYFSYSANGGKRKYFQSCFSYIFFTREEKITEKLIFGKNFKNCRKEIKIFVEDSVKMLIENENPIFAGDLQLTNAAELRLILKLTFGGI
jgi:hypothetical protein